MDRPLNIAVAGLGFMGVTHLKAWRQIPSVRLHAVVDADARKLTGDLSAVSGNLGSGGEQFDFSDVRGYRLLDEALADPAIDAVDICLPTHEHAPAATAALRAGKHVLTEKPMALDAATAETLIREAERSGRLLMAAHVLRFFPAYEALAESLRAANEVECPVRSALFRRRCAAPVWSAWLRDPARSGGGIMDLLIHDADFCISLWGMPEAVQARGYRDLARGIDVIHADLIYPGLGPVVITGGWHHPGHYPFSMEFTVTTDAATFDWAGTANDFRVYPAEGDPRSITLPEKDAFAAELAYFADCAIGNLRPDRCPPAQSAQAVALMEAMLQSRDREGAVVPNPTTQMTPVNETAVMFWAGRDPAETLAELTALGIQSGQLGLPGDLDLSCAPQWRDALKAAGFRVFTVFAAYTGESYADIPTVQQTVGFIPPATRAERERRTLAVSDFAATIGAPGIATHIGFVPESPDDPDYQAVRAMVRRICDHASGYHQTFALETGQEPARTLLAFLNDVDRPNLGINFDPANMILYGTGDPIEALGILAPRVLTVHCKDGDWPDAGISGALGKERALGEGSVGVGRFLQALRQAGYKGPLSIEREASDPARRMKDIASAIRLLSDLKSQL